MQDWSSGDNATDFFYLVVKNLQLLTDNEMLGLTSLCTPSYTMSICLVDVENHLKDGSFDLFSWKILCLETKVKCFREGVYAIYPSYRRMFSSWRVFMKHVWFTRERQWSLTTISLTFLLI